ncbi:iron complex transport system substrate-binding protein [Allochromatium warmingii]|uniref:Iron complex transport system substrate-binding protein n=1 Tax=Allochromatium warmingii TaxID=61595 RepID=A0A1H3HTB3_ALLWA|nr:ABC transporter substrate-binding protein [Allochromatium warmingii]SDY18465.1 iron complex transport system substrate-binding protein [Allochromatium warmingii]
MHNSFRSSRASQRPLLAALTLLTSLSTQAAELVDMTGRTVAIPDQIERVFAVTPPVVPLIYAIDPTKLVSLSFPFTPEDAPYVAPAVKDLLIVGRYTGEGPPPNPELLARTQPQLSIAWDMPFIDAKRVETTFQTLGTPGLFVRLEHLRDYPAALELVGRALGAEDRAATLADAIRTALTRVEQAVGAVPAHQRQRVYFAQGANGLQTECADSFHAEVIGLAGGVNVMDCKTQAMCGREPVTLEHIQTLDPDVILTDHPKFFATVKTDPAWSALRAVRDGRVYLAPSSPFSWLGRPPSFMRALAMQWLANRLYPTQFPWDAEREIPAFYALFLGIKPEVVDVRALLGTS